MVPKNWERGEEIEEGETEVRGGRPRNRIEPEGESVFLAETLKLQSEEEQEVVNLTVSAAIVERKWLESSSAWLGAERSGLDMFIFI